MNENHVDFLLDLDLHPGVQPEREPRPKPKGKGGEGVIANAKGSAKPLLPSNMQPEQEPLTLHQLLHLEPGKEVALDELRFNGALVPLPNLSDDPLECADTLLGFGLEPADVLAAHLQISEGRLVLERVEVVPATDRNGIQCYSVIDGQLTVVLAKMANVKNIKAKIWPVSNRAQALGSIFSSKIEPARWSAFRMGMFVEGLFKVEPGVEEPSLSDVAALIGQTEGTVCRYRAFAAIEPVLLRAFSSVSLIRLADAAKIVNACSVKHAEVRQGALHASVLIKRGYKLSAETSMNLLLGEPPSRQKRPIPTGGARGEAHDRFESASDHLKDLATALSQDAQGQLPWLPVPGARGDVGRVVGVGTSALLFLANCRLTAAELEGLTVALGNQLSAAKPA